MLGLHHRLHDWYSPHLHRSVSHPDAMSQDKDSPAFQWAQRHGKLKKLSIPSPHIRRYLAGQEHAWSNLWVCQGYGVVDYGLTKEAAYLRWLMCFLDREGVCVASRILTDDSWEISLTRRSGFSNMFLPMVWQNVSGKEEPVFSDSPKSESSVA